MPTILAVDTTAKAVSCALVRDQQVLAVHYGNTGMTHSQTLMPMISDMLRISGTSVEQLNAVAVNAGPGSFTGVRIGVSAVKGIAFTNDLPCVSVSTLEAMAESCVGVPNTVICGVMDARCQQVYSALFSVNNEGTPVRMTDDAAVSITDLGKQLQSYNCAITLVGDGAELCYKSLKASIPQLALAPPSVRYQNASGTALVAERLYLAGKAVAAEELLPVYLRLPQAERELNSKLNVNA